jgi:hypothetical protein
MPLVKSQLHWVVESTTLIRGVICTPLPLFGINVHFLSLFGDNDIDKVLSFTLSEACDQAWLTTFFYLRLDAVFRAVSSSLLIEWTAECWYDLRRTCEKLFVSESRTPSFQDAVLVSG